VDALTDAQLAARLVVVRGERSGFELRGSIAELLVDIAGQTSGVLTGQATINGAIGDGNAKLDAVQASLAASNQTLTTIQAANETGNQTLTGIHTLVETGNRALTTIQTAAEAGNHRLTGIHTLVETGNRALATLDATGGAGNDLLTMINGELCRLNENVRALDKGHAEIYAALMHLVEELKHRPREHDDEATGPVAPPKRGGR
jgi:hypothetical protein